MSGLSDYNAKVSRWLRRSTTTSIYARHEQTKGVDLGYHRPSVYKPNPGKPSPVTLARTKFEQRD